MSGGTSASSGRSDSDDDDDNDDDDDDEEDDEGELDENYNASRSRQQPSIARGSLMDKEMMIALPEGEASTDGKGHESEDEGHRGKGKSSSSSCCSNSGGTLVPWAQSANCESAKVGGVTYVRRTELTSNRKLSRLWKHILVSEEWISKPSKNTGNVPHICRYCKRKGKSSDAMKYAELHLRRECKNAEAANAVMEFDAKAPVAAKPKPKPMKDYVQRPETQSTMNPKSLLGEILNEKVAIVIASHALPLA